MQNAWYVENLRLTFFVGPQWAQRPLFVDLAGVSAAEVVARPQMQLHQETGNVLDAYLTVIQVPGRVDIVLSATPSAPVAKSASPDVKLFLFVGTLEESISTFSKIARNAASLIIHTVRVAYAITLLQPTDTIIAAQEILKSNLPTVNFDPQHDIDITYQINHPMVGRRGQKINRLAKWDALQASLVQITLGVGSPQPPSSMPSAFAARAYFDINTDADNTIPLTESEVHEVIEELRSLAVELAQNGDKQ